VHSNDSIHMGLRVSPYLCVLAIYLELVFAFRNKAKRFDECQCEDDNICFFPRTYVLSDGHYRWLKGLVIMLSMEHWAKYFVRTIHRLIEFLLL